MSKVIAFLGLGNMGGPMAVNLLKDGHTVHGFDPVEAAQAHARENGVDVRGTAAEAVEGADVIITMLPSGKHVLNAYQGTDGAPGLLELAAPDTLFIDSSTIAVADAREAARLADEAGHRAIDAPVSGGVVGAEAGTLAFMVGGSEENFAAAQPVLEPMAKRIVHCGEAGAGQAAKVCNNLILAVSMIGVSEAFVLGEQLGLTHEALFEVTSNATATCWALNTNCPVPGPVPTSPANRDFAGGFASALMAKDLGLAMHAVESTGTESRLGSMAAQIYQAWAAGDAARLDFSSIITEIREHSGAAGGGAA